MINYLVDSKARADINDIANQVAAQPKITVSDTTPLNPSLGDIWIGPVISVTDKYLAHFDASVLDLADNAKVATWADLSGNGNHLTQAVAANQPTFKATGFNGKPTVQFDGLATFLEKADFSLGAFDSLACFIVMQNTAATGSGAFIGVGTVVADQADECRRYMIRWSASAGALHTRINDDTLGNIGDDKTPLLYTDVYDKINSVTYKNGVVTTTTPYTNEIGAHSKLRIGSGFITVYAEFATGNISEIILVKNSTSSEITAINAGLIEKWGLV